MGVTKWGLCMALFMSFGFRHNITDPFSLETLTNEFIHEVGFVMSDIMPCFSRESNSALNFSLSDTGTLRSG